MPLPPYIERAEDDPRLRALDRERYQTFFAARAGAVAAPTAGLHFPSELIARITARGIPTVPEACSLAAGASRAGAGGPLEGSPRR